jgi:hypothetical protein
MKPSGAATVTVSPTLSILSSTNPPFPTLSLSSPTSMGLSPTTSQESTASSIITSFNQPTSTTSSSNPASTAQSTSNSPPTSSSLGPSPSSGGLTVGDKATIAGSVLGGIAILAIPLHILNLFLVFNQLRKTADHQNCDSYDYDKQEDEEDGPSSQLLTEYHTSFTIDYFISITYMGSP